MAALESIAAHLAKQDLAAVREEAHCLRLQNQKLMSEIRYIKGGGMLVDGNGGSPPIE